MNISKLHITLMISSVFAESATENPTEAINVDTATETGTNPVVDEIPQKSTETATGDLDDTWMKNFDETKIASEIEKREEKIAEQTKKNEEDKRALAELEEVREAISKFNAAEMNYKLATIDKDTFDLEFENFNRGSATAPEFIAKYNIMLEEAIKRHEDLFNAAEEALKEANEELKTARAAITVFEEANSEPGKINADKNLRKKHAELQEDVNVAEKKVQTQTKQRNNARQSKQSFEESVIKNISEGEASKLIYSTRNRRYRLFEIEKKAFDAAKAELDKFPLETQKAAADNGKFNNLKSRIKVRTKKIGLDEGRLKMLKDKSGKSQGAAADANITGSADADTTGSQATATEPVPEPTSAPEPEKVEPATEEKKKFYKTLWFWLLTIGSVALIGGIVVAILFMEK